MENDQNEPGSLDDLDRYDVEFHSMEPDRPGKIWLCCMICGYRWLVGRGFTRFEYWTKCPNPDACADY